VIERKHRVAMVRAAHNVIASDLDWRSKPAWGGRGGMLVFYKAGSLISTAMRDYLLGDEDYTVEQARSNAQDLFDDTLWAFPGCGRRYEREVGRHIALRDAPYPAAREQVVAQHAAEDRTEDAAYNAARGAIPI
jgi:hypothetical protein